MQRSPPASTAIPTAHGTSLATTVDGSKKKRRSKKDKSKQAVLDHVAAQTAANGGPAVGGTMMGMTTTAPAQDGAGAAGGGGIIASGSGSSWYQTASFEEILEDLSSRFILNLPEEELGSPERICFQLEEAHWYYEDFIRELHPSLPSYTLRKFSEIFFQVTDLPLLLHGAGSGGHDGDTDQWDWEDFANGRAYERFMRYKLRVPVCGAILINETWDKVGLSVARSGRINRGQKIASVVLLPLLTGKEMERR